MKKQLLFIILTVFLLLTASLSAFSQEQNSTKDTIANFPSRFFEKLQKSAAEMEEKLIARSTKALKKLSRQEARLKKKLAKKDSLAAEQVLGNVEEKYQQSFTSIQDINSLNNWQESGLVGVSKIISLRSKTFKETKLQLLWDFLSYQQVPRTQALKFRVRYSL